ncbi:ROK family protein [Streptomyces sp. NPDC050704]|uniref:ROK family protein n=1 Tax=Streptomyces sp. NPDC050704 TaxID=3157219 RepID=UPI0034453F1C
MFAGVDIGGTTTQVVLCTPELAVVDGLEVPTPAAAGGAAMVRAALDALELLLARGPARLLAAGVGAAGLVDTRAGRILVASDSFTDWAGFEVTATMAGELGVPVFLDNDVNAFLRGEVAEGAVAGEPHVLGMTLGTGVGGALWLDGALYDGPHGAAGEIGHVPGFGDLPCTCGGRGHLETLASGRSIGARYGDRTGGSHTARTARTALAVAEAARLGDPDALAVYEAAGAAVARAILVTAGLLDITTFVIGGGVSEAWDLLEPPILAVLAAEPPVSGHPIRVVRAGLGGSAVAIGAASRARTELREPRETRASRDSQDARDPFTPRRPHPDGGNTATTRSH